MKVLGLFNNAQSIMAVPADTVVFSEATGEEMYGIIEGEIELRIADRSSRTWASTTSSARWRCRLLAPPATVVATSDTQLAVIDGHKFRLVQETPMFALSVTSAMADRFRNRN